MPQVPEGDAVVPRVPALKALDTAEWYLRCNFCEYTSMEITDISDELVCDVHHDNYFKGTASDMLDWCERELARWVRQRDAC